MKCSEVTSKKEAKQNKNMNNGAWHINIAFIFAIIRGTHSK
jgi:hypothetical protein